MKTEILPSTVLYQDRDEYGLYDITTDMLFDEYKEHIYMQQNIIKELTELQTEHGISKVVGAIIRDKVMSPKNIEKLKRLNAVLISLQT